MNPLASCTAIALVAMMLGSFGTWKVQDWRYRAKEAQRVEAQRELERNNRKIADAASTGFEKARTKNGVRYETVTVEVEKIVDRPVYRNVCLDDDGLRLLNDQIRRLDHPGQSEPGLPGPAAAGG